MVDPIPMGLEARIARNTGPLWDSSLLPKLATAVLKIALPVYLDETTRQSGETVKIMRPASWATRPAANLTELAEQGLPRLIVVDGGTTGEPFGPSSRGIVGHQWMLGVSATVPGTNETEALERAAIYGAAVRGAIVHHLAAMNEQILDVEWLEERPGSGTPLIGDERRSIAVTENQFVVKLDGVLSYEHALELPDVPDPDGPVDGGDTDIITSTGLTVDPRQEL